MSSNYNEILEQNISCYFSQCDNYYVYEWLIKHNFSQCTEYLMSNNINGYDLCFLSNKHIHSDLKVIRFHDRSNIIRIIGEALLMQ